MKIANKDQWWIVGVVAFAVLCYGCDHSGNNPGVAWIFLIFGVLYFFPAIVASSRRHRNRSAILCLNFFLGWTVLGWVAALVWACTNEVEYDAT